MFRVGSCKGCKDRRLALQRAANNAKQKIVQSFAPKGKK